MLRNRDPDPDARYALFLPGRLAADAAWGLAWLICYADRSDLGAIKRDEREAFLRIIDNLWDGDPWTTLSEARKRLLNLRLYGDSQDRVAPLPVPDVDSPDSSVNGEAHASGVSGVSP